MPHTTRNKLDVFISWDMKEFRRIRKQLSGHINKMPFLKSNPLEARGADFDSVLEASLKGIRDCDIFVGIFGKEYSAITIEEAREAIKTKKPSLTYVKKVHKRDPRLSDFIDKELAPEFKYDPFLRNKDLVVNVKKDLDSQLSGILDEGLQSIQERKREAKKVEKRAEDELSQLPLPTQQYISLLATATNDYSRGMFMETVIVSATALEIALRNTLKQDRPLRPGQRDVKSYGLGMLILLVREQGVLHESEMTRLLWIAQNRNRALHEGWTPSREEAETALKRARNILTRLSGSKDK